MSHMYLAKMTLLTGWSVTSGQLTADPHCVHMFAGHTQKGILFEGCGWQVFYMCMPFHTCRSISCFPCPRREVSVYGRIVYLSYKIV